MLLVLLTAVALSQASTTIIVDPTFQSKKVTTTTSGAKQGMDVNCIGGCSGSSGGGGGDGGFTVVIQNQSNDGGFNWHVDVAQFGGMNAVTGTGASGAGVPRVTVSNDSTVTANAGTNLNTSALALSATQTDRTQKSQVTDGTRDGTIKAGSTAAGTGDTSFVVAVSPNTPLPAGSNVIGHVIADTGSTTAVTGNVTVVQGTGTNLHAVLDTTSTTAVTQSTASNLNALVAQGVARDGGTDWAVAAKVTDGITTAGVISGTTALKTDMSSVAGTATSTASAGVQKVGVVGSAGAAFDAVAAAAVPANALLVAGGSIAGGTNLTPLTVKAASTAAAATDTALVVQALVNNAAMSTAAAGVQKVGITGNAAAALDAANNAAAPANVLVAGFETATQGTTQPTAATAGNVRRALSANDGVLFVHPHGPVSWSCFKQAITATTECRAAPAAGLRAYVTTVTCDNQAATVQTVDVVFGTGTNCGTGTTALTHKFQMGTNATTTSPDHVQAYFSTPLVPTAANAICVRPANATAFGCTLTGYDAQ